MMIRSHWVMCVVSSAWLMLGTTATASAAAVEAPAVDREKTPGADVYRNHCASCHEGQVGKAPSKVFLELMPHDAILGAVTSGVMQVQARALTDEQRRQVADYIAGGAPAVAPAAMPKCSGPAAKFDMGRPAAMPAWGFDDANTRRIPASIAGLKSSDIPRLKLKWAMAYPNAMRARSQPTVAMGALFVGSQDGTVYSLDAKTGCVRWTYRATAEVRTPVVVAPWQDNKAPAVPLAFFGDLIGRVYAINALDGSLVWKIKVDDHPSATITSPPLYRNGTLYVGVSSLEEASADPSYPCCTFRGSLVAVDGVSGKVKWKTYTIDREPKLVGKTKAGTPSWGPSGAAIWSAMAIDDKRNLLYATTGNNYSHPADDRSDSIIAFDLGSGRIKWHWQSVANDLWNVGCMLNNANCPENAGPDFDIGAGAVLVKTASGKEVLLAGRKDGTALAIDPNNPGKPLWERKLGRGSIQGGVQWGMAADAQRAYVPIADMADSKDGKVYSEPTKGGLYALDPLTGKLLWSAVADDTCKGAEGCDSGILAAVTAVPGAVFAGHMDGRIRAYDDKTGRVLWQYDSRQEVTTLSGARAHGGSVGQAGPVVQDGMVYVNSGYGIYFHMPGNLLLAFSVDGK